MPLGGTLIGAAPILEFIRYVMLTVQLDMEPMFQGRGVGPTDSALVTAVGIQLCGTRAVTEGMAI